MTEEIEKLTPEEADELNRLMNKIGVEETKPQPQDINDPERKFGEAPLPNPPAITRVLDPTEWVEKQIATITAVGRENYLRGVKHPKKDPIKAGIDAQPKYEAKMKDPKVLARRAEQLAKTNMEEWAVMAETLGADKLVDGVVKRRHKIERFVAKYQPLLKAHLGKIDSMPDVTDADRENRMLENIRGLKKLKGKA